LAKTKIAIEDKSTKEIVLVISFRRFEDIESSQEYKHLEKLTMSLAKIRKGKSSFIKYNKAQLSGKMSASGWRGGMDNGKTVGHYIMGCSIQNSENRINE